MTTLPHKLDGSFTVGEQQRPPVRDRLLSVRSPVDGSEIGRVHEFDAGEVDEVFAAARQAGPGWRGRTLDERARLLHAAADLLEAHADPLAELICLEVAKSLKDARDEVTRSADFIRFTAEDAKRVDGSAQFSEVFPRAGRGKLAVAYRVPLGCVLAIPPFNYPVNLAVSKIAPALVSGNTVVMKPPTQGALSGVVLVEIFRRAGIPAGALAAVTGRGSRIGDLLVEHPEVDMINFTGSSETGRALAKKAGMVPLLLELGGKDAAIVMPDADLAAAADDIVAGAFAYSGQRCTAVKRVIVLDEVADELVELIRDRVSRLPVGDPRNGAVITPLVDPLGADRAEALVAEAVRAGAARVTGGQREGNLLWPIVLDHVDEAMDVAWVEPFAPVLPVVRVTDLAEAVRLVNASEYGLQAAIFSRDVDAAMHLSFLLDVGTVQINGKTSRGPDHFPFIGTKSSGMGAQGVRHSIEAMTRLKSMVFNTPARDIDQLMSRGGAAAAEQAS